jgi:hypothetical protein
MTARVEFAPDGKHWQVIKKGTIGNMFDYFNFNPDIHTQLALNKFAKVRLIGDTGLVIGTLPTRDEFHLLDKKIKSVV